MQGLIHKSSNWFIQIDMHKLIYLSPSLSAGPVGPELTLTDSALVPHFGAGRLSFGVTGYHQDNDDLVLADGARVISRAHRVRRCIVPHWPVSIVPPNPRTPLLILASDNKIEMAAASVVGPDGPVGVAIFYYVGVNMACNEPLMMPTSLCFTGGTVVVGFTLGDILAAILMSLLDALISAVVQLVGSIVNTVIFKFITGFVTVIQAILFVAAAIKGTGAIVAWLAGGAPLSGPLLAAALTELAVGFGIDAMMADSELLGA